MKKILCITTICIVIIGICYIFLRHDPTENVVKYYNTKEMTYEYSAKDAVSNLIMRFDGKMECDIHVTLTSREDEKLIQHFLVKKQKLNNYTIRTDWYYSNVQIALKSECQGNEVKLKITSY